jgi:C-terminal processing protease CtpA/Prc
MFKGVLKNKSSYIHLTNFDYINALQKLSEKINKTKTTVNVNFLTNELGKIMAEVGDRHSSVRNITFNQQDYPTYNLQMPFLLTPLEGKVLAIKKSDTIGTYKKQYSNYPFVKSINGISIKSMIDNLVYASKKAPKEAQFTRGINAIQKLGALYFKNNLELPKITKVVVTNNKKDSTVFIQLINKKNSFFTKAHLDNYKNAKAIKDGDLKSISRKLDNNIGYINFPRMYNKNEGLVTHLDSIMLKFQNTKALIIDLRYNPGGTRFFIKRMASYIVPKSHSPWVANVAYLRTDKKRKRYKSMSSRYLYKNDSEIFNATDQKAIIDFDKTFIKQQNFDTSKFSNAHYMLLKTGEISYTKPVYILVNEYSFSAASVFTSALKGLPNVKIVGVTTDGSSGNSKSFYLQHSKIRVKVSTMLSFQRNGQPLDGFGTTPDIYIPITEKEIYEGKDLLLDKLFKSIINDTDFNKY